MRHVHCAIFLNFHFFLIYKLFLPRCDLNAGERNYNVCFYMFSFMMVRNELIKWQWNNILQSKSRFAPCWWPPRSSSATSVPSRFTLLLWKPQFFRDRRLKHQLKYCMVSSNLVVLYISFICTKSCFVLLYIYYIFSEWCSPWYSNSTWGASGKGGSSIKTISPQNGKHVAKIVSGMTHQK